MSGWVARWVRIYNPPSMITRHNQCVWPNNDPPLIQMQVTRAGESLRSDILKDLRRLLQSPSGCFCVCVKVHFDTDGSHRLVSVTGPNLVCHLNNLKIFFGPLFFYLVTLWHSKSNTLKFLFSCLAGVCILSSKRLLLDMSFAELWLYENSIFMRERARERKFLH